MEPMGLHIKKINLEFANWTYEVLIKLRFIEILFYENHASTWLNLILLKTSIWSSP